MSSASDLSFTGAGQFHELEHQVNEQSKLIEAFINSHSKFHHKSESFKVLEALYKIFKQEVQINAELQEALVNDRTQNQDLNENITFLLNFMSEIVGDKFANIKELVFYLQKKGIKTKEEISLKKAERKLRSQLKESNAISGDLQTKNKELENKILMLQNQNNDFEAKISELDNSIKQKLAENKQLTENTNQNSITILTMKEKISHFENENKRLKEDIEIQKSKDKSNSDLISQLQSQLISLTTKLSQNQAMKEDLNEKVIQLETTNNLLMRTNANLKSENRENSERNETTKKALFELKTNSEDAQRYLESKVNTLERTRKELKRELKTLKEKTTAAVMKEAESADILRLKEAEFERRTKNLQFEIDRINAENLRLVSEIRDLRNKELEKERVPRNEDSSKIAKLEQKLKTAKKVSDSRKKELVEVKRELSNIKEEYEQLKNESLKLRSDSEKLRIESENFRNSTEKLRNENAKIQKEISIKNRENEEMKFSLAVQSEQIETLTKTVSRLKENSQTKPNDEEHTMRIRAEEELKWAKRECSNMRVLEKELSKIRKENSELKKRVEKSVRSSEQIAMLKARLDSVESNARAVLYCQPKFCNQNIDGVVARFKNDVREIRAATSVSSVDYSCIDSDYEPRKNVAHLDDRMIQDRINALRKDVDDLNEEVGRKE